MTERGARLLLSGYYGFGNFGDEAILQIFVAEWRKRRPGDEIAVLSATPAQTAALYAVDAVPRMSPRAVRESIARADLLVSGGGGLLQNATSLRSLLYYAGIIREAKRAGRTAAIFAQGIGPLDFFGKQIVRRACAGLDLAIVRDERSGELLRSMLPTVEVLVAADPVFLAPDKVEPAATALEREGLATIDGPLTAVVVRKARIFERTVNELAALVDRLSAKHGSHVVFVPLQRPDDAEAAIEVIRRCKSAPTLLGGGYDLRTMSALFARCTAIVSMRLHALILAARLGVPFAGIAYDPKVGALLETLAYPLPALERGVDADALADRLWRERGALKAYLAETTPAAAQRAAAGFDRLARLAEGAVAEALKQ